MLIQYQASMHSTITGIISPKATYKGAEGSSIESKGQTKNKQEEKSKEVEEVFKETIPTNTGKGYLKEQRNLLRKHLNLKQ